MLLFVQTSICKSLLHFTWRYGCTYKALGWNTLQQVDIVVVKPAVFCIINGDGKGADELVCFEGDQATAICCLNTHLGFNSQQVQVFLQAEEAISLIAHT